MFFKKLLFIISILILHVNEKQVVFFWYFIWFLLLYPIFVFIKKFPEVKFNMFQNQTISSLDRQIPSIIMLINTQTDLSSGRNGIYKVRIKI